MQYIRHPVLREVDLGDSETRELHTQLVNLSVYIVVTVAVIKSLIIIVKRLHTT